MYIYCILARVNYYEIENMQIYVNRQLPDCSLTDYYWTKLSLLTHSSRRNIYNLKSTSEKLSRQQLCTNMSIKSVHQKFLCAF